ncbi:hypothetical protein [Flavobacterium sp. AG291]|uniref:hypothetical protein n=1 Tax=Flavobacterium sp. AG291 TaxID=2184000 RepID=UPI000E0BF80B|nr:hypothetical protein [Flavobacterium sp. AG291]RDI11971.1 hypothetical protein DEU42_105133 [Flavobacterium sp. AG291]
MPLSPKTILSGWKNYLDKSEVTEDTAKQRAVVCATCSNAKQGKLLAFIKDSLTEIKGAYCALCHCPLSAKVRSTDICPDNKWNDPI